MSAFTALLNAFSREEIPSFKPVDLTGFSSPSNYTPDWPLLEQQRLVPLFVYNSLMRGFKDYKFIFHNSPDFQDYQYTAFTVNKYAMWKKKLGKETFPIPLEFRSMLNKDKHNTKDVYNLRSDVYKCAPIRGEFYLVKPKQIKVLDEMAENGVQFTRRRVSVIIPHQAWVKHPDGRIERIKRCETVSAFMYVGNHDYWSKLIDNGYNYSLVEMYHANNNYISDYFYFDKREYDIK